MYQGLVEAKFFWVIFYTMLWFTQVSIDYDISQFSYGI